VSFLLARARVAIALIAMYLACFGTADAAVTGVVPRADRTETVPVVEQPPARTTGATVVSFTVTYGDDGGTEPVRTAIVADLPDGVRTAATCEDAATAGVAVAQGLIGRAVDVKDTTFSL